ncbi:MAG: CbtA family protein, partial [Alphaproteobacteria bacterium]|nr:CbtA family protein [Alphaproteobacteria bacterium]
MVGALLWRGMLVGALAGLLAFAFLKTLGEPSVDQAIAFETQHDIGKASAHEHGGHQHGAVPQAAEPEPDLVSRAVQAGLGLFIGVAVYSTAFGGLFGLAFALAYGRIADSGPRATSALLAALGLVAVYVVPSLKYPANPPAVGDAETIGLRTALYFSMIALSLAATIAVGMLRARLQPRLGAWNATLVAGAAYIAAMAVAALALPAINEVPDGFPATVLWQFRIASLGAQAILWTTLGLLFGPLAEGLAGRPRGLAQPAEPLARRG